MSLPAVFGAEGEVDELLQRIGPCRTSNTYRSRLVRFLQTVLSQYGLALRLQGSGSNTCRTYLPMSDIDLVILPAASLSCHGAVDLQCLVSVFQALCAEVVAAEQRIAEDQQQYQPFCIRNVEFINARTKVLHLLINNICVDITVNQSSALDAASYIDRCDALLGDNHLLKRSILLVKCWCLHESARLGVSIIDSKGGLFSSYAVCVLVLRLFNMYNPHSCVGQRNDGGVLKHPLTVLRTFLYIYSEQV